MSYGDSFRTGRPVGTAVAAAAAAAAACFSLYMYVRPALHYQLKTIPARSRMDTRGQKGQSESQTPTESVPYPPNVFPGGRDVDTPYGTIKVFEWGPEDGEKVLLMHGIGTPCVALGDMARRFVARGCRVMLFDFFGRGYSDAPVDLPYDDRLYITQIFLVLASSPLPWTGSSSFHLLGYSLGGAIAAAFAAYFPRLLRSVTLVCPGGLIRTSHVSPKSRILYSQGLLPEWFLHRLVRARLEPQHGPSADVPIDGDAALEFDHVPLSTERRAPRVGDVMRWQLESNDGLVGAYVSTIRNAPIYGHHDRLWRTLSQELAQRRMAPAGEPPGLPEGRVCLVLAEDDPVAVKDEWIEDSKRVLGGDGVMIHVLPGGHEIAISKGPDVADLAMGSWQRHTWPLALAERAE